MAFSARIKNIAICKYCTGEKRPLLLPLCAAGTCYIHAVVPRSCTTSDLQCKKKKEKQTKQPPKIINTTTSLKNNNRCSPQSHLPLPKAAGGARALRAGARVRAWLVPGRERSSTGPPRVRPAGEARQGSSCRRGPPSPAPAPLWLSNRRVGLGKGPAPGCSARLPPGTRLLLVPGCAARGESSFLRSPCSPRAAKRREESPAACSRGCRPQAQRAAATSFYVANAVGAGMEVRQVPAPRGWEGGCPSWRQLGQGEQSPGLAAWGGQGRRAGQCHGNVRASRVQESRMGAAARRAPCLPPCIPGQLQAGTGGEFPKARGWEGGSGGALAGVQLTGVPGRGAAWGRHSHSAHAHAHTSLHGGPRPAASLRSRLRRAGTRAGEGDRHQLDSTTLGRPGQDSEGEPSSALYRSRELYPAPLGAAG